MKHRTIISILAISIITAVVFVVRPVDRHRPTVVGIPAYSYPSTTTMWNQLALVEGEAIVVLNPANGPGAGVDPVYTEAVGALRAPGTPDETDIYGYVDTDYGRRSADEVLADVIRYVQWYRPEGIFLDQTPSQVETVAYLVDISAQIRQQGLKVAMNPGQPDFDVRLMDAADYIVNFEGPADAYEATRFPSWARERSSKFWHLVYRVPDAESMQQVLSSAAANGAKAVFVTDRDLPNPWDALPPYWHEEVDHVHTR